MSRPSCLRLDARIACDGRTQYLTILSIRGSAYGIELKRGESHGVGTSLRKRRKGVKNFHLNCNRMSGLIGRAVAPDWRKFLISSSHSKSFYKGFSTKFM